MKVIYKEEYGGLIVSMSENEWHAISGGREAELNFDVKALDQSSQIRRLKDWHAKVGDLLAEVNS